MDRPRRLRSELLGCSSSRADQPVAVTRALFTGDGMRHRRGTRTCDGCDLCCTAMGVEEIGKDMGARCPHLTGRPGESCGIYASRPSTCRAFACIWVLDDKLLPDDMQPARCGFVLASITQRDPREGADMFTVYEDPARPGAWKRPHYLHQLRRLAAGANRMVVIGAGDDAVAVIGPRGGLYHRKDHPELFPGGLTVGCPREEYR
jgi:hypothetical protein